MSMSADGSTLGAHYSIRNAAVGSRRAARRAGTIDATSATGARRATITMSVTGSRASVRTTLFCSRRPTASEAGTPRTTPGTTTRRRSQEQPAHVRCLGAERHSDGDLLRPPPHGVRHRRIEAHAGEDERQAADLRELRRHPGRGRPRAIAQVVERPHDAKREIGIDRVRRVAGCRHDAGRPAGAAHDQRDPAGASARNGRYTMGTASPRPCRMSGDTPMIATETGGAGRVGFSQVGPLGRWQPELEVTADRTPGAEVHVGESLVHDRRFVPGSAVQLGERTRRGRDRGRPCESMRAPRPRS